MLTLILTIALGVGIAYFAIQNTSGVDIRYAGYSWSNIPLYMVALGSMLVGLLLAGILSMIDGVFTMFSMLRKDRKIHQSQQTVKHLEEKLNKLESENIALREKYHEEKTPTYQEETIARKPTLLDRLRHRLAV